jgi:hypothetical protein
VSPEKLVPSKVTLPPENLARSKATIPLLEVVAPPKVSVPLESVAPSKATLPPGSIDHCGVLSPALGGTAAVRWLLSFQASCIHWSVDASKMGQRNGIHEAIPKAGRLNKKSRAVLAGPRLVLLLPT